MDDLTGRQEPRDDHEWAELIACQFEVDTVDAIEEGLARGRMLGDVKLRGELFNAKLAFRRIGQDRQTPNAMREIARARAHYASEALGCEKHGAPFISPGICAFCDEDARAASVDTHQEGGDAKQGSVHG